MDLTFGHFYCHATGLLCVVADVSCKTLAADDAAVDMDLVGDVNHRLA